MIVNQLADPRREQFKERGEKIINLKGRRTQRLFQMSSLAPVSICHREPNSIMGRTEHRLLQQKDSLTPINASKIDELGMHLAFNTRAMEDEWSWMSLQPCFSKRLKLKA